MTIELHAEDDFADFVDGLSSVTLRRRGSSETVAIQSAWQLSGLTQEALPSEGAVLQDEVVWHLQLPDEEVAPQVGDIVIDGQDRRWTVLEVEELTKLKRWKCVARALSVAYGCQDRVDLQRAVWDDLGSGPEIVGWSYVLTALPVRIQPQEILVDGSVDPNVTKAFFQIILGEQVSLEPDDRFVAEDGTIYLLQSLEQADRLDVLPIAKVLRQDAA